jgi:hypothetical protein
MWYIYNRTLFSHKEELNSVAGKWMELENIILREMSQTQKDQYLILLVV